MKKVPFKKPPTSQYKKPEFYWRGGNTYREQEYITDEYKKALAEYRLAELELKQIEAEVADADVKLNERQGYTTALAEYLDGDTDGFTEEFQLKQDLSRIEREIKDDEDRLESLQAVHNPAVAAGLQKEKAYYMIEIQRGTKSICLASEEAKNAKEQLAACTVNSKYRQARMLEFQLDKVQRKKKYLRGLVTRTKNQFDKTRPPQSLNTNEARTERYAYLDGIEMKMAMAMYEEKKHRRPNKHANYINFLIDQIEELNARMSEIGLESEMVDTEQLRQKYLGNGEEDENDNKKKKSDSKEENENENHDNSNEI